MNSELRSLTGRRVVARVTPKLVVVVVVTLATAGLAACGGSGGVVAEVGGSPISRAAVSHWMSTLAGGDYFELSASHTLPAGLVSDPPNYAACVSRLQAAQLPGAHSTSATPTELLTKCRELYVALRIQATSYLVHAQWFTSVARDLGITATEQEVQQLFKRIRAEEYPTAADLRQYLTSRRSSLADLLFVVKLDVLQQKVTSKIASGGERATAAFADAERRWTAKTSCTTGYVVRYCKQFKGTRTYPGFSPAVLMEKVAAFVTGRCVNRLACAKQ